MLISSRRFDRKLKGISLLEVLITITIMASVLALAVPLIGHFKRKGQDVACMANLRSLHTYFSSYLLDHAMVWPQPPENIGDDGSTEENDELAEFWIKTLEPYGAHRDTWLCPSERTSFAEDFDEKRFDASYIPTQYDSTPNIAYQWGSQPWLIERGGFHSGDCNKVMPDGSIQKQYMPLFAK